MPQTMKLRIDDAQSLSVNYFHFEVPSETEIDHYREYQVGCLYYLASCLKSPIYHEMGRFNRHYLPWHSPSSWNLCLGVLGTLATLPAWALGAVIEQSGIWLDGKTIKYHKSSVFRPPVKELRPLNIATRNCALLPEMVSNHSRLDLAKNRLPALLQSFHQIADNIDVLCLQEVFCFEDELIKSLQEKYGYFLSHIARDPFLLHSGLWVASKHPIEECFFVYFPLPFIAPVDGEQKFGLFADGLANKGACFVLIKIEDHYELVVNTHYPSNANIVNDAKRMVEEESRSTSEQILFAALFQYLEALRLNGKSPLRVYFAGDTNLSNKQEHGLVNMERDRHSLAFNHTFSNPNPDIGTWLGGINHLQTQGVNFDYIGVLDLCWLPTYTRSVSLHQDETKFVSDHGLLMMHHGQRENEAWNSSPASSRKNSFYNLQK